MTALRNVKHIGRIIVLAAGLFGGAVLSVVPAHAETTSTSTNTGTTAPTTTTPTPTTDKDRLTNIISKGDAEITRRLTKLSTLSEKINATTKLNASDKTVLGNEVSSTITGLTNLKVKLDAETTSAGAITDAKDIYTEYRVYALVVPKVNLIQVADDQQVAETNLTTLADKLTTKLNDDQKAGKDVASLQSKLTDMRIQLQTSTNISGTVQKAVLALEPTDYNSDHTILTGYNTSLKTAHTANQAALADGKAIVNGLKSLQ